MNCQDVQQLCPLYLSGELDGPRADEFAAHLKTCSACATEVEQQVELDRKLGSIVRSEEIDSSAVDNRVRKMIARPRRWFAVGSIAAAVLIAMVGYQVGWGRTARVYADAARDHRREVVERQHRTWYFDPEEVRALAGRAGVSSSVVGALAANGYRLECGKLCRLDGRPFLHLIYSNGSRELSVFVRPGDADVPPGPPRGKVSGRLVYTADLGSEHLAFFQTTQLTAMVVAEQSADAALSYALFAAGVL